VAQQPNLIRTIAQVRLMSSQTDCGDSETTVSDDEWKVLVGSRSARPHQPTGSKFSGAEMDVQRVSSSTRVSSHCRRCRP
jgi:hypothetical protein